MFKSNKKIFIMIGVYTVILLAVIGMFLFVQTTNNKNAVTSIYMTTKTIQAGETVDDTLLATKVKKVDYPVSAVKEIESNGGAVVTSPSQISALVAVGNIPAGQPLTKELFEAITPSIYGDYTSKTYAKGTSYEWKFENPDYIILSVDKKNMPINGFAKGEEISIEGYSKYSYEITPADGDKQAEIAEGTYSGILTNHAVVHNLVYDESGTLTYVGVIVEQDKYPLISTVAKNGELIYHSGYTEAWETTTNNQYSQLLLGHGIYLKDVIEAPINLNYVDKDDNEVEITLSDFVAPEEEFDNTKFIYPSFFRVQNSQSDSSHETHNVTLTSPYPYATIVHYNLNGTAGQYMDATGLNTSKTYNSKTGLFTYTFKQDYAEGYYEITFGAKDSNDSVTLRQRVCFVVEQDDYDVDLEKSDSLTMNLNFTNGTKNTTKSNYDGYTTTNAFDYISDSTKYEYKEVNENGNTIVYVLDGDNELLRATKGNEALVEYKKTISDYGYDGVSYKVVIRLKNSASSGVSGHDMGSGTSESVGTASTKKLIYIFSSYTIYDSDGKDTVDSGTKIAIAKEIIDNYSKFAVELEIPTSGETGNAYVKETSNYDDAGFSNLANQDDNKAVTFTGVYSKEYFKNLKIRGIDLSQTITDVDNLTYTNLFNSLTEYGTFGNEKIKNVTLVLNDDIKIQLFYSFSGNRYYADRATIAQLAESLGVSTDKLYEVLVASRLTNNDVNTLFNSIFNENVLNALKADDKDVQDLVKLVGFIFTNSEIDLSNLYSKEVTDENNQSTSVRMFNADDLVSFIEGLKVEFELSNGETITSNIKVNR